MAYPSWYGIRMRMRLRRHVACFMWNEVPKGLFIGLSTAQYELLAYEVGFKMMWNSFIYYFEAYPAKPMASEYPEMVEDLIREIGLTLIQKADLERWKV